MGYDHSRIIANHPHAELVAVIDVNEQRRDEVAKTLGTRSSDSLASVLHDIDAVSVCTPDHLHVDYVLEALAARKRVLVEKPMATSSSAALKMVTAAKWDANALTVGHLLDADPRVERARAILRSGGIGDLWHVRIRRHASRAVAQHVGENSSVGWFGTIHDADLLINLVDAAPVEVHATGVANLISQGWDVIDATITFDNGVYATLHESWTLAAARANRSDSGIVLIGSEGSLEIDLGHGQVLHSTEDKSVAPDVMHYPSQSLRDSSDLQVQLDRWIRSCQGQQLGVSGERALAAVQLVDRIHASLQ